MASLCLPFWFWGDEKLIYVSEISSLFLSLLYPLKWYCCRKPNSWRYDSSEKTRFPLSKMWSIFLRNGECYQIPLLLLTIFVLTKTTWMTVFRPLALWIARRGLRTRHTRKIFKTDTAPALGRSSRTWTSKGGQRHGEAKMGKSKIDKWRWSKMDK